MSEQERVQACLRKEIRSLLISAKDGLTPQQLEKEYLLMVGSHVPLRALGYRSTMELVLDMPDVVSVCPRADGAVILKGRLRFQCLQKETLIQEWCLAIILHLRQRILIFFFAGAGVCVG